MTSVNLNMNIKADMVHGTRRMKIDGKILDQLRQHLCNIFLPLVKDRRVLSSHKLYLKSLRRMSLKLEIRLHADWVGTNTRSDTEVNFTLI